MAMSPPGSEPTGQPLSGRAPWDAPEYEPDSRTSDRGGAAARGAGITTTASLVRQLDRGQPAGASNAASTVTAEWALWGKEGDGGRSDYHVLRCSQGTFGLNDFQEIISRYTSGVKETLPQYTVCWIPAGQADQGFLGVGIHELADRDPQRSGGRARTTGGRQIEYVRLFCVRYAELKKLGLGYADLIKAVWEHQLIADLTGPIEVELPETARPRLLPHPFPQLAENVATLLLTTRPVCVLGADAATAEERLVFIDQVMSLLPYGLRTTMSASTWASSTAQDLKLRLFFTNARLDDESRTHYVTWGQPGKLRFPAEEDAPALYLAWLRSLGSRAAPALLGVTAPVRFSPAEIRQMVANLPKDKPIADTLKELADHLRHHDGAAASAVVTRLRRYLISEPDPAEREEYQQIIARLRLLGNHPGVEPDINVKVYRVLLNLAFETPLSYDSYCCVEDALGSQPRGLLRTVMLMLEFTTFLPWLLTAKVERAFTNEALMGGLAEQGVPAAAPLDELQQDVEILRLEHRATVCDFAVWYLRTYAEDAGAELRQRGYLAGTLEIVFPRGLQAQRIRLEDTLRLVHGAPLSRSQITELFADPLTRPTEAFEAAVKRLSPSKAGPFIAEQAAYARLRDAGYGDDARILQSGTQRRYRITQRPSRILQRGAPRRSRRRARRVTLDMSDTIWGFPKPTVYGALIIVALAIAILGVVLSVYARLGPPT